jgi:two-component system phosphate regulon response regulator PhoB
MVGKKILVVEDEPDTQQLLKYNLQREGFSVVCAGTGMEGIQAAVREKPDLVVLDMMLPDIGGLEVCRELKHKKQTQPIPILFLTARSEDADIVSGLEVGADDYMVKPFSVRVLVSRIRARLRIQPKNDQKVIRHNGLVVDPNSYTVTIDNTPIPLTLSEFRILALLAHNPGSVFSRYEIVDAIHGQDMVVTDRSVDVHIFGLRQKLKSYGQHIETVRGVGYRMK